MMSAGGALSGSPGDLFYKTFSFMFLNLPRAKRYSETPLGHVSSVCGFTAAQAAEAEQCLDRLRRFLMIWTDLDRFLPIQ